jgi:hypothetical protein
MFIRRTVIAASLIAVPIAFAAPAFADTPTPCSYFGDETRSGICGAPDLAGTFGNVQTNLHNNFSPDVAAGHLQDNFNPGTAAGNLEHNVTHGVGTDDPAE